MLQRSSRYHSIRVMITGAEKRFSFSSRRRLGMGTLRGGLSGSILSKQGQFRRSLIAVSGRCQMSTVVRVVGWESHWKRCRTVCPPLTVLPARGEHRPAPFPMRLPPHHSDPRGHLAKTRDGTRIPPKLALISCNDNLLSCSRTYRNITKISKYHF